MNLSTDSNSVAWEQYNIDLPDISVKHLLSLLHKAVFFDSSCYPQVENTALKQNNVDIISGNPIQDLYLSEESNSFPASISQLRYPSSLHKVPFTVGYLGFIKYELGNSLLKISNNPSKNELSQSNNYYIGLYTWSIIRSNDNAIVTFSPLCNKEARKEIKLHIESALNLVTEREDTHPTINSDLEIDWTLSSSEERYKEKFRKINQYINAGDTYQVNYTQRFEADTALSSLDLYFYYRKITRTPYSFFISLDSGYDILSFSPERFIQIKNSIVKTSPIKGTMANNGNSQNAKLLSKSEKDKAENLMIVDLLRNDLSKVSELNSVTVEKLFSLESFNNVHHLVSEIKSKLSQEISELDAFLKSFPGGSITGAPKKRAMEIIKETEAHSRDAYCGSAFYWNFDGNFDSNILIRTIVKKQSRLFCWAGGGITASSKAEDEYAESLLKVSNITGIEPT